jgi:hypothetical protein
VDHSPQGKARQSLAAAMQKARRIHRASTEHLTVSERSRVGFTVPDPCDREFVHKQHGFGCSENSRDEDPDYSLPDFHGG